MCHLVSARCVWYAPDHSGVQDRKVKGLVSFGTVDLVRLSPSGESSLSQIVPVSFLTTQVSGLPQV